MISDPMAIIRQALPYVGLVALLILLIVAVSFGNAIRNAKRERQTDSWQDAVVPEWSNVSVKDFDSLRHLLGTTARPMAREDVVLGVVRRHKAMLYFGSVPSALLMMGGVMLIFIGSVTIPAWLTDPIFLYRVEAPVWILGLLLLVYAAVAFTAVWIHWRYRYYLLTNFGVHIADVFPVKLAFLPGDTRTLPYGRIGLPRQDDSFLGNICGYTTARLGTNMGADEDGPFNDMDFVPINCGFIDVVRANQPGGETTLPADA